MAASIIIRGGINDDTKSSTWITFFDRLAKACNALPGNATGSYLVANLPVSTEGQLSYASNGLKMGETTGNGTGVPVYYSTGKWRRFSDDTQVAS